MRQLPLLFLLSAFASHAFAQAPRCPTGFVFEDRNGNGERDPGERGLPGVAVSDGQHIVRSDAQGRWQLQPVDGRTVFLIKPAGYDVANRGDGLPDIWVHQQREAALPALKYGGIAPSGGGCHDFALRPAKKAGKALDVLVFSDSQTKSTQDIDYYWRDIVQPLVGKHGARFGVTLGDIVNDDLSLYPEILRTTMSLGIPWMHVPGNHDLDFDAASDEDSLRTFRQHLGPDTYAWEEPQMVFVGLDDVIYRPGQKPAYVGGLREDQFEFLQAYLPTVPKDRLLVIGVHIPFFVEDPARPTFRAADRERLFGLLKDFPHVLLLSGHSHTQRHWYHGADAGWHGAKPLHEYNVGAACGAFWSGAKDADGIPDTTMADGTPNGYARLRVSSKGDYRLSWHAARDAANSGIGLHAPKVLRQGAYPAFAVYANVYMGQDDSVVEYRVDGGEWKPMRKVGQPDPRLQQENALDDAAEHLRGYDRSPEAEPTAHLWRGVLPTDLNVGEHRIEVRTQDPWRGELTETTTYRLEEGAP